MNNKLKEILSNDNIHIIECDKNWCNAYGYEKSQLKEDLLDYITNLEQVADTRMKTLLKIEQYLIDSGVDDEILECCDIYDVNGVELRKYIEKLKGGK